MVGYNGIHDFLVWLSTGSNPVENLDNDELANKNLLISLSIYKEIPKILIFKIIWCTLTL